MSLFKAFGLLWKATEKSDSARIAGLVPPDGILEKTEIPYGNGNNPYHLFDAFFPAKNNGSLPVIIDIHGGGWMYGDKNLNGFYCKYLASRGFLVFSVSYRLVPEVTVKAQLEDINNALIKIKSILNKFPCNPDSITLTGDSAGGQLAAYTAAFPSSEPLRRAFGLPAHGLRFSKLVLTSPVPFMNEKGLMGLYTRMMWGEKPTLGKCPTHFLGIDEVLAECTEYPETLLITSSGDFVARAQTHRLHELFMRKGIPSRLLDFPKYDGKTLLHVFAVTEPYSPAGRDCLDRTARFILNK